jgi:hemerythrin superfamily protein
MATNKKASGTTRQPTPTQMLRADHRKVKQLFKQFEEAQSFREAQRICEAAITELLVHSKIEEEIFYPAAREHLGDEELMEEAKQEHHVVDVLIEELQEASPSDQHGETEFCAKFMVMAENVKHHIEEEEGEMFPKFDKADVDHKAIAEQMAARKQELERQPEQLRPQLAK